MSTEIYNHLTDAEWLDRRANDITSTEAATLFGLGRRGATLFEIWNRKKNKQRLEIEPNERMKWGNRLEAAISRGLAEDNNWKIENLTGRNLYVSDSKLRLGASYDNFINCPIRGNGVGEIKVVDFIRYRDDWNEKEDEAPDYFEIQLQTQLLLLKKLNWDFTWGVLAPLVAGNSLKIYFRERDDEIGAAIEKKVAEFWASIEANEPPEIDFLRDYKILEMLYDKRDKTKIIELPDLESKLVRYEEIKAEEKLLEAEGNEIKAILLVNSAEAGKVFAGAMQASIAHVLGTPDSIWSEEEAKALIGQTRKGRSGYNRVTVSKRKIK